jgi:RNA polymerase sigma-70 factor (ECF subfamily)
MDRVQAGDPEAFGILFGRYRVSLYGYLRRMVYRGELADELFQDTFLNVHRARSTWSSHHGSFRSWLYRIATNLVRDRARSQVRRPEILSDELERGHRSDPADRLALERALGRLPDHLRDAFLLGAVDGFDHHEMAVALSVSPENARARLSRARSLLREMLEPS